MNRVVHLTSAHPRDDIRIFIKESLSLVKFGYEVSLVVADGQGDELRNGVCIYDVGQFRGRIDRIKNGPGRVLQKALKLDATLYHLHDPELLTIALKLKKHGKKVIFDAHEDFPKQLLGKPYLNKWMAKAISIFSSYYEKYICSKLDAIVAATPSIRDKFQEINKLSIDVNNYPLPKELVSLDKDWDNISNEIIYVGGISKIRGICELVESMALTKVNVKLNLVGSFNESDTYNEVKQSNGWVHVNELGQLDRVQVKEILSKSVAGVVTFLPLPNHIDAQPNKMFEYMSAGIPVIASNYPLWKNIIEGNNCGICVDPESPQEIATAIDRLVNDKVYAKKLGENGMIAVNSKFNWSIEEIKLKDIYDTILGG